MNYEKIYEQLMERAQYENRKKGMGIYYEQHHIIPHCLGGNNNKYNLVLLFFETRNNIDEITRLKTRV